MQIKQQVVMGVRKEFRLVVCEQEGFTLLITNIRFHIVKTLKYMLNEKMQSHKPLLSRMVNTNWPLIEEGVLKCYNKKSSYFLLYLSRQYYLPKNSYMQGTILRFI